MPASMLIRHSNTSFLRVQLPSPAIRLLTLTESLVSPGKVGKIHFSAQTAPLKIFALLVCPPPPLHRCYHIVHIKIDVRDAIYGVGWAWVSLRYFRNGSVSWHWEQHVHQCICNVCKCF